MATVMKEGGFLWKMDYLTYVWTMYTTSQKYLNSKIFLCFFKEFSSAHQACIYLIQNTAKVVILWNIFTI